MVRAPELPRNGLTARAMPLPSAQFPVDSPRRHRLRGTARRTAEAPPKPSGMSRFLANTYGGRGQRRSGVAPACALTFSSTLLCAHSPLPDSDLPLYPRTSGCSPTARITLASADLLGTAFLHGKGGGAVS